MIRAIFRTAGLIRPLALSYALTFALCCTLALAISRPYAQSAVLFKNLRFTAHDKAIKGANNYGDLQGPAIENRHFALFVSAMEAHIHADMIGKRIAGPQLYRFAQDINRHGGWDWGEDILKVGLTLAAGTPGLLVNGSIQTFDIAKMDSLIIAIPDSSVAHPELRVWAYGWKAGLPAPVDFRWTLRTRLEDRFMQGEVILLTSGSGSPLVGVTIAMGVIKAPQAFVRSDSARAQLAMTGLPTYFNDSALLAVRSSPVWFRGFFDQEGSVGLRLLPDAQGAVRWTQGGSWIQEPQPVWRQSGWETTWLPPPTGTTALRRAPQSDHGSSTGKNAPSPLRTWKFRTVNGRILASPR